MNIESINILRRNGHIVWTRESGLPYPTDWAIADARPIRQEAPVRDAASFAIKAPLSVLDEATDLQPVHIARALPTAQGGTKKEQAIAIYRNMMAAGKFKADIIVAFCTELQMSEAGATTYYYTAKKAVAST